MKRITARFVSFAVALGKAHQGNDGGKIKVKNFFKKRNIFRNIAVTIIPEENERAKRARLSSVTSEGGIAQSKRQTGGHALPFASMI